MSEIKLLITSIKYLYGERKLFGWKNCIILLAKGVRFDPEHPINTWNARVK